MSYWGFEPIFDSYLAVAGLAAILLLVLLAPTTFQAVSPRRRLVLLGLRLLVTLLVVLAMLRPTAITSDAERQSAVFIVMADVTRSMDLPNSSDEGGTRWEAQVALLRRAAPLLKQLDENLEVRLYGFGDQLSPLVWDGGQIQMPAKPEGAVTDIGVSLDEALRREVGQRLAGVLLLSDGMQTAYQPKVELHRVARDIARLDCPLYAVAFGPSGSASQFADVAVENLPEQYSVFIKNELTVEAVLRVRGYVNRPIPATMEITDPNGQVTTIGPVTVSVREDGESAPIRLRFTPKIPGPHSLTVRVESQPRERVTENNELTAFLNVRDGGLKVAYLIGGVLSSPPGEQIRLRRALAQSPDIELDHRFIYDAEDDRQRWPIDIRSILDDPYDVILIENLDSTALGKANIDALAELVGRGRGLMMIGGYHSFGPGGYRPTKLADVLPIEMPRFVRQELGLGKPIQTELHLPGPLQMLPTRPHPITRLAIGEEDNQALWRKLPPLLGANRFDKLKPRSLVLASSAANDPLLVAGEYGSGRVLAFAGDSTRRWTHDYRAEHKRFWRQAILWLAKRDEDDAKDIWIRLPQRRFQTGSKMQFTAGARTGGGDEIPNATGEAWLVDPKGVRVDLPLNRDEDKWRGGFESFDQGGKHTLHFRASVDGKVLGETTADMMVSARDLELSNPAANPEQLARLAAATKDAGGQLVPADQLLSVLQQLIDTPPKMEVEVQKKWQLATTPIGAWFYFLLLVALLGVEWFLRKQWRMV